LCLKNKNIYLQFKLKDNRNRRGPGTREKVRSRTIKKKRQQEYNSINMYKELISLMYKNFMQMGKEDTKTLLLY
jgi:hypothetical protein